MTYLFDNLGRYYEPNIGVSFNSIEFWKRLLEYVFFSGKWTEFTPHTLIFYPYFFATKCRRPLIIKTVNSVRSNNLITKKLSSWQELSFFYNCNHTIKKKSSLLTTAFYRRHQIFIGDPKFIIGDPKLFIIIPKFSLETPRFS